jgi:hypothetical protein
LQQTATVELKDDADNVRYDKVSRRLWLRYGDGGLAAIDPESGKQVADIKLNAHPESFQLENEGKRIFLSAPERLERGKFLSSAESYSLARGDFDDRLRPGIKLNGSQSGTWTRQMRERNAITRSFVTTQSGKGAADL